MIFNIEVIKIAGYSYLMANVTNSLNLKVLS